MRIALLSDPHFTVDTPVGRKDSVRKAMLAKMVFMHEYFNQSGIRHVLVAGDFCDVKRSWDLLSFLTDELQKWRNDGIKVYTVLGQHDSYYHNVENRSTVLGVLISSGLVYRLDDEPTVFHTGASGPDHLIHVYGSSWGQTIPEAGEGKHRILVVHQPISTKQMYKTQTNLILAPRFLATHKQYELILCGDAHYRFVFEKGGRIICNAGPIMRLESSMEMLVHEPAMFIYSTQKRKLTEVKLPYDKEALSREHLEQLEHDKEDFDKFVAELLQDNRNQLSFENVLRMYLKKHQSDYNDRVMKRLSEVLKSEF